MQTDVLRIETFHHADKDKVEKYILELLIWLQQLAIKSIDVGGMRSIIKSSVGPVPRKTDQHPIKSHLPLLTMDEENMLQLVSRKIWIRGISKSLDFDNIMKAKLREDSKLTKSWSLSSSKDFACNRISSELPVIGFGIDKERAMNVIDRLEVVR